MAFALPGAAGGLEVPALGEQGAWLPALWVQEAVGGAAGELLGQVGPS